ncbi:MAG: alanine--tRNA ligase [Ruminococcaceae bacterium]|nr:alanine--tRNA ligase [Oscillospiraceae bacterium]
MKWTGLNDLRESYLSFFESKDHLRMASAPLVPQGDNSILLINAGMTPLKKYFQGIEEPPRHRVTTCQKCIRTPDIENVGKTARHGTYFEMLGNFSFGDYFKHEAIAWAWEYLTKTLEIPEDKLWVTIYEEDDEAGEIWATEVGVPRDRIIKLGKKDNFWEHGSGPCGPCSEIHYDRGEKYGPFESFEQASDCDRIIEIWNNVFTQFDNDGKGNYTQLATKNIDTGMGLERLACVMQDVDNLFEVDTIQNIMKKICSIANVTYKENENSDISIRVITDHIRSTTFMVGDGVRPSNEGRGYVLRRLLRRAARHGRLLGVNKPFLYEVCDTVIDENLTAYPELAEKREYIKKVIRTEEESFAKTVDKGMQILGEYIEELKGTENPVLSGDKVFKLHDTYGFPLDLTREILQEKNIGIDEEKFYELMNQQKANARANQAFKGGWDEATATALNVFTTTFVGYTELTAETKILAMIKNGEVCDSISEGEEATVVIETVPFYAESGGQVGDCGTILSGDNVMQVVDTKKTAAGQYILSCIVESGSFYVNDAVTASVDKAKRMATARNHTCAHLLQSALRTVLGDHVHQAGSYVDPYRCRFDFSHFSAVTAEEIEKIEAIVNDAILMGIPVITEELPIEEARKKGAMALFGEKYGDVVRVVQAGDISTEFCGGTHLDNTAKAGLFKIVSESSVASGVRRIEAVTGFNVLSEYNKAKEVIASAAQTLKVANPAALLQKCESIMAEMHTMQGEIDRLNSVISASQLKELGDSKEVNGIKLINATLSGVTGDNLRKAGDEIKNNNESFIALLAGTADGKGNFLCICSKEAIEKGANAGKIVKEIAAIAGGKGGGRPDSAMAGIADLSKIDEALAALEGIVSGMIG